MTEKYASLLPEVLLTEMTTLSASDFERRYGRTFLLLVEVANVDDEFLPSLSRLAESPTRRRKPSLTSALTTTEFPAFARDLKAPHPDGAELLARLEDRTWFVLPLLGRADATDVAARRVTVGRAPDRDIVLNDRSVSARHAHFEYYEDGSLSLTDDGSTNGTTVNGQRLLAGEARWLQPMDHMRFGRISTFTSVPAVLRSVMRARSLR